MMTHNELAIVLFPLVAAVLIGGMVWLVTGITVGRSKARQALRAGAVTLSPDGQGWKRDVIRTEAGTYFRLNDLEKAALAGLGKLSRTAERDALAEQGSAMPGTRKGSVKQKIAIPPEET